MQGYALTMIITKPDEEKDALSAIAQAGCSGATILRGKGTVSKRLLRLLGLEEQTKAIFLVVTPENATDGLHAEVNRVISLKKRGHGLMLTLGLRRARGLIDMQEGPRIPCVKGGRETMSHELMMVVVNKGLALDVVETAREAGASGATVLHARGSGAHTREKFFNLNIDPEKEIVMMVVSEDVAAAVANAVDEAFKLDRPNSGILFSLPIDAVSGLLTNQA